jgi:hypothetical protein
MGGTAGVDHVENPHTAAALGGAFNDGGQDGGLMHGQLHMIKYWAYFPPRSYDWPVINAIAQNI